jgi:hypothetical protein
VDGPICNSPRSVFLFFYFVLFIVLLVPIFGIAVRLIKVRIVIVTVEVSNSILLIARPEAAVTNAIWCVHRQPFAAGTNHVKLATAFIEPGAASCLMPAAGKIFTHSHDRYLQRGWLTIVQGTIFLIVLEAVDEVDDESVDHKRGDDSHRSGGISVKVRRLGDADKEAAQVDKETGHD